jgi:hypothetical protein
MSNQSSYNGGLPPQQVFGQPARAGAIEQQKAGDDKQLSLINTGGSRRRKIRGGTGSNPSQNTISPPVVANTGGTSDSRVVQQYSYNKLASLSGGVTENSKFDSEQKGGRRNRKSKRTRKTRRTRRTKRTRKTRKNMKRRKYY